MARSPGYVAAQLIGAFVGVAVAYFMFGEALFSASVKRNSG
jgi:glycerol uptake facilitator-like aquaporin